MDKGNIVAVQGTSGGVEYGKYIVPLVSSHLPFGDDFNLGPPTYHIEASRGVGAVVYDYRKGKSDWGAWLITQGGSRFAPLPWAIFRPPLRGCEPPPRFAPVADSFVSLSLYE